MKKIIIIAGALLFGLQSLGEASKDTVNICDRTPQVRAEILEIINEDRWFFKRSCEKVSLKDLRKIEALNLYYKNIISLKSYDFKGLINMKHLNLHNNRLLSLPEGVFDSFSNLRSLDLSYNRLTSLPEGVFDSLSKLEVLYLYRNNISSLPEGFYERLSRLEYLYVDNILYQKIHLGRLSSDVKVTVN